MNTDVKYMQRCLELANQGLGNVSPNPMVGCVIVHEGNIIGEGFHQQYGGPHAEVNAINKVKNKELLKKSTLYVNLEPCCHYGKTPPCTDLIIENKIPNIMIGCIDSTAKVNGKGITQLQNAGCNVTVGILEDKSKELNKRFFTFNERLRPYIILKWAQTIDRFMDIERTEETKFNTYWITNAKIKILNHKWRTEEDAIMIGKNTGLHDNPQLTVREWIGKNPLRIIIDKKLHIPQHYFIFDQFTPTLVFTSENKESSINLEFIKINFEKNILPQILNILFEKNILSVIVEGGKQFLESFIHQNLWDEATVQIGNKIFNIGLKAPVIPAQPLFTMGIDKDKLIFYRNI